MTRFRDDSDWSPRLQRTLPSSVWHHHSPDRPGLQAAAGAIHPGPQRTLTHPDSGTVGGSLRNAPSAASTQAGRTQPEALDKRCLFLEHTRSLIPLLPQNPSNSLTFQEGPLLLCLVHSRHLTISGNSWNNYSILKSTKLRLRS